MKFKDNRYSKMLYRRCGKSGIQLPVISLGLWHNFGDVDDEKIYRKTLHTAFDNGIIHFDLANNYGTPPGSAECNFGKVLHKDFRHYRDEMIISSKAGYYMWPGPFGDWGSKKYLVSSLDQSLGRMKLDYVDVFYHHRPDPNTPLEETMATLDLIVRQGKALYVGISNYPPQEAAIAINMLKALGTPCFIHQPRYSMFDRWVEGGLLDLLGKEGIGSVAFSPLAQGLLTDKYLKGIPKNSRASKKHGFLKKEAITPEKVEQVKKLNKLAAARNQSLAQMALAWVLKDVRITSVLVGASSPEQLLDAIKSIDNLHFEQQELMAIEEILIQGE
ncbi:MAG: aldo/keto reductase [Sphingobacteriales bacterium]|nr:aldo/keto reductase [Sphingobacteriales bacterium]